MSFTSATDVPWRDRTPVPRELPTGTVTFLITDVEGSTSLVVELGAAYPDVLERHNALLRDAVARNAGLTVSTAGDSVFAVFRTAHDAVCAAIVAQRALREEEWPGSRVVRVRMGVHSGEGALGGDDYVGLDVHRAARISAAAHGGQILTSATTAALLGGSVGLADLGEHRLKDLVTPERLYQVVAPGLDPSFPPVRSLGGILTVLPTPRTNFVARPEVAAVASAVRANRIVTLTGPGGTGKTRLSVEVARLVKGEFQDGVVLVDLSSVLDDDLVPVTVVDALGLEAGSAPADQRLLHHLAERRMLIILDNFEQVTGAATLVGRLVTRCPRITVLVTSRSPLRLAGEQEFPVPPLDLPTVTADTATVAESPAVRLFVDRARRVRPSFEVTQDNAAAVAAIVRRLDGLPLALELAAARIRLLSPAALAARLASTGSADLAARDRDVPVRQRTMESVIAWSYDLLSPQAKTALCRMAVFSGGGTLEELDPVVCPDRSGDLLALLEELSDQSLIRQDEVGDEPRFSMLMTIAEFAAARLAESGQEGDAWLRHAETYLGLAEKAAPYLTGWDQRRWLDRLEQEHDNLRAAFDRCVRTGDASRAQRFAASLWRFWQIRGHLDEGARRVADALALTGEDAALRARGLEAAGGIAWWRGDLDEARRTYQEALDILLPTGDRATVANARYNLGLAFGFRGFVEPGKAQLALARQEAAEAGDRRVEAWAVWGISDVGVAAGDWDLAARSADEALAMFRDLDDPFGIGWSLFMSASGHLRRAGGDLELARRRLQDGARLFAGFRDISAITLHCGSMARVEAMMGRSDRALRLVGASRALRERTGAGLLDVNDEMLAVFDESVGDLASKGLAEEEAERLVAEGARFSPEEAVAYILEEMPDPNEGVTGIPA